MITPALWFSEPILAGNVRYLDRIAINRNYRWAARLTGSIPMHLLRDVILPATKLASCSTIMDAEYLAEAGFHKITLTGRVVDTQSLQQLRWVAQRTQIVAVIDHFRHAELLSQSVSPSASEIQILVEVDTGQRSSGVQPGADAALLAAAAARLPGLKVVGVFASAMDVPKVRETGAPAQHLAAAVRIATHGWQSIHHGAADFFETVVAVSAVSESSIADTRFNSLIVSPFSGCNDQMQNLGQQSSICLVSTVISRPSLEYCVINAGEWSFGDASGLRVEAPAGASILHVMPETCTLLLSGEANDLRIGDTVRLRSHNPEYLLHRSLRG